MDIRARFSSPLHILNWPIMFLSMLVLLGQTACGAPTPVMEPVEIRFIHRPPDSVFFTRAVEKFSQEYPEITVKLMPVDDINLNQIDVLKPDCVVASMYGLGGSQRKLSEKFISLDGYLEQEGTLKLDDYYPALLRLVSWEGKTWAIPAGVDPIVMFYNMKLFDQAGLSYPAPGWTWDDFLTAAIAITNRESGTWGYVPLTGVADALMFIFQHGGNIVDDINNPTRVIFNDPLTVEALEWYANLFHGYKVAPSYKELGSGRAAYQLVFGSKVGMWSLPFEQRGGEWSEREYTWPFRLGIAPLPRDAQPATYGDVEIYAITAQSQSPDACWQWISFLSAQVDEAYRLVPARRSVAESREYEQVVGREVATAVRASVENAIIPPSIDQFMAFMPGLEAFDRAVQRILAGEITAQEAMDWAQQQAEK